MVEIAVAAEDVPVVEDVVAVAADVRVVVVDVMVVDMAGVEEDTNTLATDLHGFTRITS